MLAVMPVKWIFFDVGETLLDETASWQDQFERLAATLDAKGRPTSIETIWQAFSRCVPRFRPGAVASRLCRIREKR